MKETKICEWIYRKRIDDSRIEVFRIPKRFKGKLKHGNYVIRIYKLESEI